LIRLVLINYILSAIWFSDDKDRVAIVPENMSATYRSIVPIG
jgi:hypothetical protein